MWCVSIGGAFLLFGVAVGLWEAVTAIDVIEWKGSCRACFRWKKKDYVNMEGS